MHCNMIFAFATWYLNLYTICFQLSGETVDFAELVDVHIPALILKTFFRELPEPILTVELYDEMLRVHGKFCCVGMCVCGMGGCGVV